MTKPDDDTPDETPGTPRRLGKKGTLQSLSAAEYAAKRGASLYVRPSVSPAPSGDTTPMKPS